MKLFKTTNGLAKKVGAFSLIAALVFNPLAAVTQAANEISRLVPFQGRLHGTDNKAVADGVYDITFNVYDTPTGGTPSWTESHSQVSVIHGYVNVLLGAITPMHDVNYPNVTATPAYDPSKNQVDFTKKKYLGISINGGVEMFPRSQLVPSFHAYTANHADHATTSDHALQADQASNSAKLNNQSASYYATASGLSSSNSRISTLEGRFSGSKASDADKLDGLDSTNYMRQENRNGYLGFAPNGSTSTWVRTPQSGLLPYQSGGHGSLGTSSWRFNDIHGNNIYDGGTLLENKFLGISSKAVDADKLDNLNSTDFLRNTGKAVDADKLDNVDSSNFARTDTGVAVEVFNNDVDIVGADLYIGHSGKGDSDLHFHDDNSNTERTLHWDDSANTFMFEDNDGVMRPMLQIRKGTFNSTQDAAETITFTRFPNAVLFAQAFRRGANGKSILPTVSYTNGSLKVDRHGDFDGTFPLEWIAIGY